MSNDGSGKSNGRERDDELGQVERAAEASPADEMSFWKSDECPPEVSAQFWGSVVAYETAPWTTHFQDLEDNGVGLPPPQELDDRALTDKLWEVVNQLARMRVFLSQTNHLSDRELYTELWREVLREETKQLPLDEFSAWHLDLVSSGSEEDTYLYLKYYSDEDERRRWRVDFPDDEMPDHEDPPYDRDRYLPRPTDKRLSELEDDLPM